MNPISILNFTTNDPSTKSLSIMPGKMRRQIAMAVMTDTAGSPITLKGRIRFLKSGSAVRELPFGFTFTLTDTATHRFMEINSVGDWAPTFAVFDASLQIIAPITNGVMLNNATMGQPVDLGAIDCDSVSVAVESVINVGAADTSGSLAIISTE